MALPLLPSPFLLPTTLGSTLASASFTNSSPPSTLSSALLSPLSPSCQRCKSTCPSLACCSPPWCPSTSSTLPGPPSPTRPRMSASLQDSFRAQTQQWRQASPPRPPPPAQMARPTPTSPLSPWSASSSGSSACSTRPSQPRDREPS